MKGRRILLIPLILAAICLAVWLVPPFRIVLWVLPPFQGDIHAAARAGQTVQVRRILIARPWLLEKSGWQLITPLQVASKAGRTDVVALLLEKDADVNANARASSDYTPLHYAVTKEVVVSLLANGADIDAQTEDGQTSLLLAVRSERRAVLRALAEGDALQFPRRPGPFTRVGLDGPPPHDGEQNNHSTKNRVDHLILH